jgi:nucleotide-binding universal stress UspA family protein
MKNILVPVDFSDVTDAVVDAAFEQAVSSGALIHVVHASAPDPVYVGYGVGPIHEIELHEKILDSEKKQLNTIVTSLRERGVNAVSNLPEGPIMESLMKEIKDNNIDLVVIGSHGHGAVFNIIAGSVTQALLRRAKVPVLVVPSRRE